MKTLSKEERKVKLIKEYIVEFEKKEISFQNLLDRIVSTIIDNDFLNEMSKDKGFIL